MLMPTDIVETKGWRISHRTTEEEIEIPLQGKISIHVTFSTQVKVTIEGKFKKRVSLQKQERSRSRSRRSGFKSAALSTFRSREKISGSRRT